jgi:hypothetical protein
MLAAACAASLLLSGCQQVRDALAGPTDAELLAAASLTTEDAAADALFQPYPNGDRVVGETSLDLCYGDFPSEDLRVGRRQVAISDPSGEAWVSSEAILYSYPEEAARAMDEVERARQACPDTAVEAPRDGRDPLVWEFGDPPDGSWPDQPGVRRQAYAFTVTDPAGDRRSATATYLQRGRMILALYASPGIAPASTLRNSPDPARFVQVMSRRLDALPLSSLQEPNPVVPYEDPDDISA